MNNLAQETAVNPAISRFNHIRSELIPKLSQYGFEQIDVEMFKYRQQFYINIYGARNGSYGQLYTCVISKFEPRDSGYATNLWNMAKPLWNSLHHPGASQLENDISDLIWELHGFQYTDLNQNLDEE